MSDLPLTPMERRLMEALERMEADWQDREAHLSEQIKTLEAQLAAQNALIAQQNEAITRLQAWLVRLTSQASSPSSPAR